MTPTQTSPKANSLGDRRAAAAAPDTRRRFTSPGQDVYDSARWVRRDARIGAGDEVVFAQDGVEFPEAWSDTAVNIVASKYFRGAAGSPEREWSLRQLIDRVVDTITAWGETDGYFAAGADAEAFAEELRWLLLHQRVAFNSPVWFNIGVAGVPQQASACFILAVDDTMESILGWYTEEGRIFKGGSGAGVNLSAIRASCEPLTGGGQASGPVSFMRGADASAGSIRSGGKTRRAAKMVLLDVDHPDVEEFIWCKALEERKARALAAAGFEMGVDGADIHSVQYQNANNSVRLCDEFMDAVQAGGDWELVSRTDGRTVKTLPARDLLAQIAQAAWECADPGVQFSTTINAWHTAPNAGPITASNPCSEYVHLDNSACNLASINLLAFLDSPGSFDVDGFAHTCAVTITAQDILVGRADYPTAAIADTTRRYRQLGLGYSNLGAALMAQGLAYDSTEGRSWAASVTGLMTAAAYAASARLASRVGPFDGYTGDRDAMTAVLRRHRDANAAVEAKAPPRPGASAAAMWRTAEALWDQAVRSCEDGPGVRNSQATVIAPTGTISFMMDCDTTGIEPDLGLIKHKTLSGGGHLRLVNRTVGRALTALGYCPDEVSGVEDHIRVHGGVASAPYLTEDHKEVFRCAMGADAISPGGHILMMGEVQPLISGAISKTVNLPDTATPDDIEELLVGAWTVGVKAVAVYRDASKVAQPLSTASTDDEPAPEPGPGPAASGSVRTLLPSKRNSRTISFVVGDCHGFATFGEYPNGAPGEIFLRVAKGGSTLAGVMDAFAIAVSLGLQHGVPLDAYIDSFAGLRFEPAGITDDPELRMATSLVDYLARRLAVEYLDPATRAGLGVLTTSERLDPALPGLDTFQPAAADTTVYGAGSNGAGANGAGGNGAVDAPICMTCGERMARAGVCWACSGCGATSGCS